MPRYYFDLISDNDQLLDIEGTECVDDDAAHAKAKSDLRQMIGEILKCGEVIDVVGIRVHCADEREVGSVDVKAAISPYFAQAFFAVRNTDW